MATTKRKPKNSLKSDSMFANFKRIEGMTDNQDDMIESFRQGLNVVAVGSAGTGKTYVAMALALEATRRRSRNWEHHLHDGEETIRRSKIGCVCRIEGSKENAAIHRKKARYDEGEIR